ncbi:MAG TPA: preprotein translocase subunit YajC [Thermoanaerobaculia bacterium]|nr:preprotein translocase subunit YajC [Thermoanaerobaculia bacterium]
MYTIALLQSAGTAGSLLYQFLPIVAIGLVFYFLVIAPASKQRRQQSEMLNSLKKGDRVLTSGGIYGTIQGVEAEVVYLKIAENVKVKVARSAVSGVVNTGDAE